MGRSKELFHHMREKQMNNDYLDYYFFYKKKSDLKNKEKLIQSKGLTIGY